MSMLIILGITLALLAIGLFLLNKLPKDSDLAGWFLVPATILLVALTPFNAGSYIFHKNDVGLLKAQVEVIRVYEENVVELKEQLNSMQIQSPPNLMNGDSPVASLTTAIATAVDKLASAKATRAKAHVSIVQRYEGPFGYIVSDEDLQLIKGE